MGGGYDSKNARMLMLATAAIERNCGYYIKQINGPAHGIWQMEPDTEQDIWDNCDALRDQNFFNTINFLENGCGEGNQELIISPLYACAIARLKYAMDPNPLPPHNEIFEIYRYYKRIYNTESGASTFDKFKAAWKSNSLDKINLD